MNTYIYKHMIEACGSRLASNLQHLPYICMIADSEFIVQT